MYSDFFKLHCLPFEDRADRRFFYARPKTEEALAATVCDIRNGKGLSLVLGSAGIGKTMFIRKLLQRLDQTENAVVLTWPMAGLVDLIRESAKAFGVTLPASHLHSRCLARLRRHLTRTLRRGRHSVLIIDQAENLTADNIAQLSTLADLEGKRAKLLRIVVVGQPHIRTLLAQPEFADVAQRFYGEHVLDSLSSTETKEYIRHRLRIAGALNDTVFDSTAVPLIHEASQGVPRSINHLCNDAMLAAYGAGVSRISRRLMAETIGQTELRERSIPARDLGVATTEHVAAGLEASGVSAVGATSTMAVTVTPELASGDVGQADRIEGSDMPQTDEHAPYLSDRLGDRDYPDPSTGDWYTAGTPTPSSWTAGQDLLNRLESALARADRMQVTTEATLTQFTAIERHLTTLTGAADRLVGRLGESVRHGSNSLEQLERRVEARFRQGEDRLAEAEARVEQAAAESSSTERQRQEINCARESAERVETRLRSFVEEVADKVDQIQERVAMLMSNVEAADAVHGKLDESVDRVATAFDAAEQKAANLRKKLDDSAGEAINAQRAELDGMIEVAATRIEALRASISERGVEMKNAEQQAADLRKKLQESASDAINVQRAELDRMMESAATQIEVLRESISEGRLEMNSVVEACHANTAQSVELIDRRVSNLKQTLETLENRRGQIETSIAPVASALASAKSQADELTASTERVRSSIDELSSRAATSVNYLSGAVDRAEQLLPEVRDTCGHLDATQLSLAATLEDMGRTCQRVSAVQLEAAGVRDIGDRLALACENGAKIAERIEKSAASGQELRQRIDQSVVEARAQNDRVAALNDGTGHLLDDLRQAATSGQGVLDQMQDSRDALDAAVDAGDRRLAELLVGQTSSENTVKQLEDLTSSARQMLDAAQSVIAHADDKIRQMGSHEAAATNITRALSEATVKGHGVVEHLNESTDTITQLIDEGREHLERLIKDVGVLSTRTQSDTQALKAEGDKASALIETLEDASPKANELIAGLTERLEQAQQSMTTIAGRCDRAGELAERLETITGLLSAAEERETSIKQADEKARATQDLLAHAGETAAKHGDDLQQLNAVAHGLIETYAQMNCETDTAIERLEAQISATQKSVEVGEPMLSEFIAQSRAIERNLGELHSKACDVECVVNEAVARPTEILASAQAQADQLERVCGAVKKVFSSLSQATLDAKTQSGVCAQVTKQATAQVGAITDQSAGAVQTLREWTEEAVRAQARLERTLTACPTIRETHPGEAIRHVARHNTGPSERLANPSGANGQLAVLPTPSVTAIAPKQATGKPASRAEEISHLIEDAKRAAV